MNKLKPSLVQMPDPNELWNDGGHIGVLYLDRTKWFEIQDDPRFSIKYSDEKVFYNEDHEVFMQAVGEVELFEGKAVVYFQIALGE